MLPDKAAVTRLTGAALFGPNDDWQTSIRHMTANACAQIVPGKVTPSRHRRERRPITPPGHPGHHTTLADMTDAGQR